MRMMSQSPQTGQVYFNGEVLATASSLYYMVSIPSNGQVYFNLRSRDLRKPVDVNCLNPLKRVKFISIGL